METLKFVFLVTIAIVLTLFFIYNNVYSIVPSKIAKLYISQKHIISKIDLTNSFSTLINDTYSFETKNTESTKRNTEIEQFKLKKSADFKVVLNGYVKVGYGNRLYALLSSLLMAILLDAYLVTDWPEIDKYIQEPIHRTFNKSYYLQYSKINTSDLVFFAKGKIPWIVHKDVQMLSKLEIPEDKMIYHFNGFNAYFMELCCVPKYQQKLLDYGLVDGEVVKRAQEALKRQKCLTYTQARLGSSSGF